MQFLNQSFGIRDFKIWNFKYMDLLKPNFGLLIWTLLAFLVVLFILGKYAWPAIVKAIEATGARHC